MTKNELLEYAEAHGISGVSSSMTKAEILAVIEAALNPTPETYAISEDTAVDNEKTYYTLTGALVTTPDVEDIRTYYEYDNGVYTLTSDIEIDGEKDYYTVTAEEVATPEGNPSESGYYERV